MGAWAGAGCGGRVGLACGVLLLPGFGVSSSSPQVPGHPTSICDAGVKGSCKVHKQSILVCFNQSTVSQIKLVSLRFIYC